MKIQDIKKRINKAIKTLNQMDNQLNFMFSEKDYMIELQCHGKTGNRFGTFEKMCFFEDFSKKETCYEELMEFVEVICAAVRLNDPTAYHNRVV